MSLYLLGSRGEAPGRFFFRRVSPRGSRERVRWQAAPPPTCLGTVRPQGPVGERCFVIRPGVPRAKKPGRDCATRPVARALNRRGSAADGTRDGHHRFGRTEGGVHGP